VVTPRVPTRGLSVTTATLLTLLGVALWLVNSASAVGSTPTPATVVGSPGIPHMALLIGKLGAGGGAYVPVRVFWAASSTLNACYNVTDTSGGSEYGNFFLSALNYVTVKSTSLILYSDSNDSSHTYAVQATNCNGVTSAWVVAPNVSVDIYGFGADDTLTGDWTQDTGGAFHSATAGSKLILTESIDHIDIIAHVGPGEGGAKILVDGNAVADISTYSRTAGDRVVWVRNFATTKTHKVTMVNLGTSGHPHLDFDAVSHWTT
jgi:hypothetical protein